MMPWPETIGYVSEHLRIIQPIGATLLLSPVPQLEDQFAQFSFVGAQHVLQDNRACSSQDVDCVDRKDVMRPRHGGRIKMIGGANISMVLYQEFVVWADQECVVRTGIPIVLKFGCELIKHSRAGFGSEHGTLHQEVPTK